MPKMKQLNVRSDKAYEIASRLSKRTGRPRSDIVLAALLKYAEERNVKRMTPKERAFVDELMALARRSAAVVNPQMSSDHSDLYDDRGLPK